MQFERSRPAVITTEPEDLLLDGIGLLHGGIQAKATGTQRLKAPREEQIYKINEDAKKKSWTPLREVRVSIPTYAGEAPRKTGGLQAAIIGETRVSSVPT